MTPTEDLDKEEEEGNKFTIDKCEIGKTGHCALHGIEIERRRFAQKGVNDLKRHVEEVTDMHVAKLLTFKNNINGAIVYGGALLLIIVLGSYTYQYTHIQSAEAKYEYFQNKLEDADMERKATLAEMSLIRIEQGRGQERTFAINHKLENIEQMVSLLLQTDRARTVKDNK